MPDLSLFSHPLSIERGTNAPVKAGFWPWFEPFLWEIPLKPFNMFPLRSEAARSGKDQSGGQIIFTPKIDGFVPENTKVDEFVPENTES